MGFRSLDLESEIHWDLKNEDRLGCEMDSQLLEESEMKRDLQNQQQLELQMDS